MAKKDNTIYWIIGIVVVVALMINSQIPKEEGMIGLTPHYYKDGVEVFSQRGFFGSIVTPPGGSYDNIAFTISATNTGPPIDLQIVDASPLTFKNALPTTTQSLEIGESKTLWISDLMDTEQFEAVSPVNFWIKISGFNEFTGEIIYEEGYSGDISFVAEDQTATETFFSNLFSIVNVGGQTYVNDIGTYRFVVYDEIFVCTDYTGSGYLTGIDISCQKGGITSCQVFIDGSEYLNLDSIEIPLGFDDNLGRIVDNNFIRFENSLKVQCRFSSKYHWIGYSISYMTD